MWEPIPKEQVLKDAKILLSTWAMKKKVNGTFRARMNAQGYNQEDGHHYLENSKAAPVVTDITVRIALTLAVLVGWIRILLDV